MADTFIAPPLWRERDSLGIVYMCRGFSFSTKACCEVGRAFAALEAAGSLARYPHFEAALKLCKDAMLANAAGDDGNFVECTPHTGWCLVVIVAIFAALARERELRGTQHDEKVVDVEKLIVAHDAASGERVRDPPTISQRRFCFWGHWILQAIEDGIITFNTETGEAVVNEKELTLLKMG